MGLTKKGYASSGTAEIYYEVYGRGKPVIFLHGNGENMKYFRNNARFFSKRYQTIFIDTRAHGKSTRGKEPMNFETLADDVFNVMRELRLAKAAVVGFSDGGNTALTMALIAEEKLTKVVLCGANLSPGGLTLPSAFGVLEIYLKSLLQMAINPAKRTQAEIVNLMVSYPQIPAEALNQISIPVLVMAGQRDMIKRRHTQEIYDNIARAKLKIVAGGDHFIMRKRASLCNGLIDEFLAKR